MKTVVKKDWLVSKLAENRDNHRARFEKALSAFRDLAIKRFENNIKNVRAGKPVPLYLDLVQPQDQTQDYNRVLGMLGVMESDTVELSEDDYSKFVMDNWQWKLDFIGSTAAYVQEG